MHSNLELDLIDIILQCRIVDAFMLYHVTLFNLYNLFTGKLQQCPAELHTGTKKLHLIIYINRFNQIIISNTMLPNYYLRYNVAILLLVKLCGQIITCNIVLPDYFLLDYKYIFDCKLYEVIYKCIFFLKSK